MLRGLAFVDDVALRKIQLDEQATFCLEPAVDAKERRETSQQQARANEERERERHLRGDEHGPEALLAGRTRHAPLAFTERRREVPSRRLNPRYDADQYSSGDSNDSGERQNPPVQLELVEARDAPGVAGAEQIDCPDRH